MLVSVFFAAGWFLGACVASLWVWRKIFSLNISTPLLSGREAS